MTELICAMIILDNQAKRQVVKLSNCYHLVKVSYSLSVYEVIWARKSPKALFFCWGGGGGGVLSFWSYTLMSFRFYTFIKQASSFTSFFSHLPIIKKTKRVFYFCSAKWDLKEVYQTIFFFFEEILIALRSLVCGILILGREYCFRLIR
jgi:hypothetical protein